MAQFIGTTKGMRGEASRLGSKSSGITTKTNGWDSGVRVVGSHADGKDVFYIYQTAGSNGRNSEVLLGTIKAGVYEPA